MAVFDDIDLLVEAAVGDHSLIGDHGALARLVRVFNGVNGRVTAGQRQRGAGEDGGKEFRFHFSLNCEISSGVPVVISQFKLK